MLEDFTSIVNKDLSGEQVINHVIHLVSTKQITIDISNKDIEGSTVINNVTISLSKSFEYQQLIEKQTLLEEKSASLSEDDAKGRLDISAQINHQKKLIKKYVKDTLTLAEQFSRIEINTDRLQRAKEFFDNGDFAQARAVFEIELDQMKDEQTRLLIEREKYETSILPKLKTNSEEFLVLALATQTDFTDPNRFTKTNEHFENSIRSFKNKDNLISYADFLREHNFLSNAHYYYHEILDHCSDELSRSEYGVILGNLGLIHTEFAASGHVGINDYKRALEIWNRINDESPGNYVQFQIATTLNLISAWYVEMNDFDQALQNTQEALRIFRQIDGSSFDELPIRIALQLRNMALCNKSLDKFKEAEEQLHEALVICGQIQEENRQEKIHLFSRIDGDLADLYKKQNNPELARKHHLDCVKRRRKLVDISIFRYLPELAHGLYNLAFHCQDESGFDEALKYSEEAHDYYHQLSSLNPDAYLDRVCASHTQLGMLYKDIRNYEQAAHYFDKAIIEVRNLVQIDLKRYVHDLGVTLINYAQLKQKQKDLEGSLVYFKEALEVYESLAEANPKIYLRWLALTSDNFGILHTELRNFDEAIGLHNKAVNIYRKLALENPDVYLPQIASSLGSLGNVYLTTKDSGIALKHYDEAYTVLKPFTAANQQHNLYYLSRIIRNSAFAYEQLGQHEKALTKLTESLRITKNLAQKNRHHLYDLAEIHEQTASVHFENKDFANSIREAKNALEIHENLSQENPVTRLKKVARCSFHIGASYCEEGDNELAKEGFKRTLENYRALLKLSKNEETTIDNAVEAMNYFFKAQVCMLTVQGTADEDLNTYCTEFKSVMKSSGLSDTECVEMLTRKLPQMFGPT